MMLHFQHPFRDYMKLRPYQSEAIDSIKKTFKISDRQYIELPTGAGKTITFLEYASKNHEKIMIVVPSKELLNQVYETAILFYHSSEISRKGNRYDEKISKCHICIINSIRDVYLEYLCIQGFDLIIIDEAHHAQSTSYRRLIKKIENTKLLGVTATPDRLDGKFISEILHICSYRKSIEQMINDKFLCDIEGYSIRTNIDISDIQDHNRDFSIRQLYKKLAIPQRDAIILDSYIQHLSKRKTLIFCLNIEHSKQIQKLFAKSGISIAHIDGTMDSAQRATILKAFREGNISVLTNCQLLSEGFDEPSIDGIILARPTKSRSLFLQMIGRGLRIHPKKENCIIIDITENHSSCSSFNAIVNAEKHKPIQSFHSLHQLKDYMCKQTVELAEYSIQKIDNIFVKPIENIYATESMLDYLNTNNILYFEPLMFEEGSFLIWHNELKKEFNNGAHKRTA